MRPLGPCCGSLAVLQGLPDKSEFQQNPIGGPGAGCGPLRLSYDPAQTIREEPPPFACDQPSSLAAFRNAVTQAVREEVRVIVPLLRDVVSLAVRAEVSPPGLLSAVAEPKAFSLQHQEPKEPKVHVPPLRSEHPQKMDCLVEDDLVYMLDAVGDTRHNCRGIVSEESGQQWQVFTKGGVDANRDHTNEGLASSTNSSNYEQPAANLISEKFPDDQKSLNSVDEALAREIDGLIDNPEQVFAMLPDNFCTRLMRAGMHRALHLQEPERTGFLKRILANSRFIATCNLVIFLNAIFAAYTADWDIKHVLADVQSSRSSGFINSVELAFMAFYVLELVLKLLNHGGYFFVNKDWAWNVFDTGLVCLSVYEQSLALAGVGRGSSITFMRMLRLLKLSKVLRLFRALRFLQELRLMITAIVRTLGSLFWALVFLTFMIYIFSLIILQGLTGYLQEGNAEPEVKESITQLFGSMSTTMLSLYQVTTGGDDWGRYYDTIDSSGSLYSQLFLFYIAFFTFAVVNVLTGMIVENVTGLANDDEQSQVIQYRKVRKAVQEEARQLFFKLDRKGDGMIDREQFQCALESEEMRALMHSINLDVKDGDMFFKVLLEAGRSDHVNVNTFVDGCARMKGYATAIDMQSVLAEIRAIHMKLSGIGKLVSEAPVPQGML